MFGKIALIILLVAYVECLFNTKSKCEPITTPLCSFLSSRGYNATSFPNIHNHRRQAEALTELNQLVPLLTSKCAKELPFFLCSTYLPYCMEDSEDIFKPCRSLCTKSQTGCESLMSRFGFTWPFNCSLYPDETKGELCFGQGQTNEPGSTKKPVTTMVSNTTKRKGRKMKGKEAGNEGEEVKIKCPKGNVIEVRKVNHKKSLCCSEASKIVLQAICNKKTTCIFSVKQDTFGGHCQNRVGNVVVKYKCIPASQSTPSC